MACKFLQAIAAVRRSISMGEADAPQRDARSVAAELQSLLLGADCLEPFLVEVTRPAASAVADGLSCGISVQATSRSRMLGAASDEFARQMDAIQYAVDDGPCLTCLRTGTAVVVDESRPISDGLPLRGVAARRAPPCHYRSP
jgi:hypothetical protein